MEPKDALLSQENRRQLILNALSDDECLSLYCEALLTDPKITMLNELAMQPSFEVERVFVPLRLSQERQLKYDTPVNDKASTKTMEDDPDVWIEEERQRRGEVIYDLEKAIHSFHRCVITGGSGAGKTTLLRHLAIMAAQRSIAGMSSLLPIYVEQQSFVRTGLHDLLDFVSTSWEEAYGFPALQTRFLLANFLDEGKALLLLDALDETVVGERPESAELPYEAVSEAILTLVTSYPKAALVVTTRQANYKQHKPLAGFTTLELMDLRFEDVKQLIQNWYEAANDLHIEEKRTDLIKRLDENPHLQILVANPFLLTLMLIAYEDKRDLHERRADFYRMYIEKLLAKWDAQLGARRQEFKPEQKHQLLKVIAWHFHCKRQRYFTEHDLLQIIAAFLPAIGLPVERKHDMLQEIESEQAILQKRATGWHGFLHLTFQEYFAAEYIYDYHKEAELLRHRADPWWEEVMLFYPGIIPDASFFLQQLYSQNGSIREDIFTTNVLLAGRCMSARPTVKETDLPAQIIERLFELVMSAPFSLLRQEAIKVVCSIGVVETNRRLVTLLSDNQLHTFVQRSITAALGSLGEPSVADELVQLLSDEQLDVNLRRSIADALGSIGEPSVTASVMVHLLADEQQDMFVRRRITGALGILGEPSVADDLVQLLFDERLNTELRKSIAEALGTLGERSVVGDLVQLLLDEQQDVTVRRAIAIALGTLGERAVAARVMVQLLSDERLGVFVRRSIADALGTLGERSVAADLVKLLSDKRLEVILRRSIADTLAVYTHDLSIVAGLVKLLPNKEISDSVYRALWTISRRARVWIVPRDLTAKSSATQTQAAYEMVPWE
jgi:HEAT repeat protein/energy-coupling factor transporter ATP-binding protein EcfA2